MPAAWLAPRGSQSASEPGLLRVRSIPCKALQAGPIMYDYQFAKQDYHLAPNQYLLQPCSFKRQEDTP